jgi:UDP-N-acetylglucosamine enolpyruvyl transferase
LIKELNYLGISAHESGISVSGEVNVSGSKSESNRLLILQSLFPGISLKNLSNSDDTRYLKRALESKEQAIDIGHAGTAMRFLTAYFATRKGREVLLTGSERMQNRPIGILVDALRSLGADIQYEKKEGYPPLRIRGKKLDETEVGIQGNVSSQYISALLLVAPSLENGLRLKLLGEVTSVPYINMTLALLEDLGIECGWNGHVVVDEEFRSSVPSIYAVGDVTDRPQLTPVAIRDGHAFADREFAGMMRDIDEMGGMTAAGSRLHGTPGEAETCSVPERCSGSLARRGQAPLPGAEGHPRPTAARHGPLATARSSQDEGIGALVSF